MYINNRLLNQLAKAQDIPCGDMHSRLRRLLSGGGTPRLHVFNTIKPIIFNIVSDVESLCGGFTPVGKKGWVEFLDRVILMIEEVLCAVSWLATQGMGVGGRIINGAMLGLRGILESLRYDIANGLLTTPETTQYFSNKCLQIQAWILIIEAIDLLDELNIKRPIQIIHQPNPITCPEVVNEDWIRDYLNQYDEIQGVVLEMVISMLLAAAAVIAAALAAAALVGSTALASAITAATSAIQSALAWFIGGRAAAAVAAGFVAAISATCVAEEGDDTGIEVEEPGSGFCCIEGEVDEDITDQDTCENEENQGNWEDKLSQCHLEVDK